MSHLTAAQRGNIETLLQEKYTNKQKGWDPGQTAGRLHDDPAWKDLPAVVCAETIYVWIYTSAFAMETA